MKRKEDKIGEPFRRDKSVRHPNQDFLLEDDAASSKLKVPILFIFTLD
jgi:hypothetical protein